MPTAGLQMTIGGTAKVYCVHNRGKREVTDIAYDSALTKPHMCACCENIFLERTDEPMFCPTCRGPYRHPLGGPLAPPKGLI